MSSAISIRKSTVTGIHHMKVGPHAAVILDVTPNNSIPHIDPKCMKVVFPTAVHRSLLKEITYPKNPSYDDQKTN